MSCLRRSVDHFESFDSSRADLRVELIGKLLI